MLSESRPSFLHAASAIPAHIVPLSARIWLRQFDRGFNGLQQELQRRDERIGQLEYENQILRKALAGATSRMRCCVFVHVPRTAGSSVLSSLVNRALQLGIHFRDLYQESIRSCGDPARALDVLRQTPPPDDRRTRCLFHHHTSQNISEFFRKDETVFATLLRDPVDRFISDAFHYKRLFDRAPAGEEAWKADLVSMSLELAELSADFVESLRPGELRAREILEIAAAQPCFADYYFKFFWSLCMNEAAPQGRCGDDAVRRLATQLRRQFAVIGSFDDLDRSYAEIAAAFGMACDGERLDRHMMKGHARPDITDSEKLRFRRLFELDYRLLEELGK